VSLTGLANCVDGEVSVGSLRVVGCQANQGAEEGRAGHGIPACVTVGEGDSSTLSR
jgi:hypothetical protein